jgi:hypothetical protein
MRCRRLSLIPRASGSSAQCVLCHTDHYGSSSSAEGLGNLAGSLAVERVFLRDRMVLVQPEMERGALPVSEYSGLGAGIFKASGSTDPVKVLSGARTLSSRRRSSSR